MSSITPKHVSCKALNFTWQNIKLKCYYGTSGCWCSYRASTLLMLTSAFQSSNSESSSISSPEHAAGSCSSRCVAGPCSPLSSGDSSEVTGPTNLVSYLQINRILKQAHFQSLQCRGHLRDTWRPDVPLSATRGLSPWGARSTTRWFTSLSSSHPSPVTVISHSSTYLWMETSSWSGIWRGYIIQTNQNDNHFSNNNCVINLSIFCDPLDFWPVGFTCCSRSLIVTDWWWRIPVFSLKCCMKTVLL